jgi:NitT/TauT family transport system substrate-binding protein
MQTLLLQIMTQQQSAVLMVTHDIDEALLLGDRVLLMARHPGRIYREWSVTQPIVAEPFNATAENLGTGKILRFTGDVWKDHACCVVFLHEEDIAQRQEWAQRVVNALVKAQVWIRDNRQETAQILSKEGRAQYTPHPLPALQRTLTYYDKEFYGRQGAIKHPN